MHRIINLNFPSEAVPSLTFIYFTRGTNRLVNDMAQGRASDEQKRKFYIIPLLSYEKSLVPEVDKFLGSEQASLVDLGRPCSALEAFIKWRWYRTSDG